MLGVSDIKPIEQKPDLDHTGKADFNAIYSQPDPRLYCRTMQSLEYEIPQQALPYFNLFVERFLDYTSQKTPITVLDLGASYGITGALLKWGLSLSELYRHYVQDQAVDAGHSTLLDGRTPRDDLLINGLDVSNVALAYAQKQGYIDQSIAVNLEVEHANDAQRALIGATNIVVSTGCIGYVTEISLRKILDICSPNKPWMTHCVLRMFDLEPYIQLLSSYGYHVWQHKVLLPQRRFASIEEQNQVVDRLHEQGIDVTGFEMEGYLYARILLAIPQEAHDMMTATQRYPFA